MSEEAPNAGIIGRIMRVIEVHDRVRPDMKGNHLESIENMLHATLGEKDAEIARLNESHYTVCRGLAESILIIVRKLADRDDEIARLKASRRVMLTDEQLLAAYYSVDGRENAGRTGIREERLRSVQAAIFDANKFSR